MTRLHAIRAVILTLLMAAMPATSWAHPADGKPRPKANKSAKSQPQESEQDMRYRLVRERNAREAVENERDHERRRQQHLYDEKMARWRDYQYDMRNTHMLHPDGTKTRGASWNQFQRIEHWEGR